MKCALCFGNIKKECHKHLKCEHVTHYACMPEEQTGYGKYINHCCACLGDSNYTPPTLPIKEPHEYNGINYVLEDIYATEHASPKDILGKHPTMIELVIGEDYHLQKLLGCGIRIQHFLDFGYTWDDLVKFRDLSKPGDHRIAALLALRCTPDLFRDYPQELPLKKMGLTPTNLVMSFGMYFDGNLLVSTKKTNNGWFKNETQTKNRWYLGDLYRLGFTWDNLTKDLEMNRLQQWYGLMPKDVSNSEKFKMGISSNKLKTLF